MESCGWLQGSLVKQENVLDILNIFGDADLISDFLNKNNNDSVGIFRLNDNEIWCVYINVFCS